MKDNRELIYIRSETSWHVNTRTNLFKQGQQTDAVTQYMHLEFITADY